jgi:hypothetical protein
MNQSFSNLQIRKLYKTAEIDRSWYRRTHNLANPRYIQHRKSK